MSAIPAFSTKHKSNRAILLIVTSVSSGVWEEEGAPPSADKAHCSPRSNKELYVCHYEFSVASDRLMT